ncbi:alpha/beta hydrolase-fold protein [Sinomonas sp. JGH33]|uniref:Alpha/beta hydrolase-fold protein n=1 Tax=Sinomonas terricola TaxID=3110330 RepID=A0ABU5T8U2_9MICC|nr:alpha/beta hydrolase-fold protein [Sinomonas sp. JGH33]MEA5456108.1 alpha/beta hydrolase-fold protein [Sinomonas sp. JGH33]
MDALYDVRIVDGPVAVVCWVLALAGLGTLAVLAARPRKDPWHRAAIICLGAVVAAAAVTGVVHWLLVDIGNVFPEDLPAEVLVASGFGVLGVVLAVAALIRIGLARRAWRLRVFAVLSAAAMALLSGQLINAYFGLNLTVADLAGVSLSHIRPLDASLERPARPTAALAAWNRSDVLPAHGELRTAKIPATSSGFSARPAYVYLPPAYFAPTRPELPVLLLVPGQPGNPSDWIVGGRLRHKLDRFAADHGGVAPVAVVVDPNGSPSANTMCMDTKLGRSESYLVQDVVPWVKEHLSVAADASMWAAGGFSFGGTCSVQLLAKHPELVGSALGFAAEQEPALAKDRAKTIDLAFDGDAAAFESEVPETFFASRRHDGLLLFLAAGSRDQDFTRQAKVIAGQAQASGVEVHEFSADGEGHSWEMIAKAWPSGLDLLARRWGIA